MSTLWRWIRGTPSSRSAPRKWRRITPTLLIGPVLDRPAYLELMRLGVTHVIDLRAENPDDDDPANVLGVNWLRIPVVDRYPPTDGQLEQLAAWLKGTGPDPVVYIHCQGGLERSPTVAMALLIRAGYELPEARAAVIRAHPHARPTSAQDAWLSHVATTPALPAAPGWEQP